jgi:hypothetical protein
MALQPETETLVNSFTTGPSDLRVEIIDDTILRLKEAGVWSKLTALYVLAAHDGQAAKRNWVSSGQFDLTLGDTPVFIADVGYRGDGVNDYLNTNLPGDDPGFTTESASMGVWIHRNPSGGSQYLIGQASSTNDRISLAQNDSTGSLAGRLGSSGGSLVSLGSAPTNSVHLTVTRTNDDEITRYVNGTSALVAGSGTPDFNAASNIWLLARASSFSNATISIAYFGEGLDATDVAKVHDILRTYLARIQIADHPYATPEQFGAVGDADLEAAGIGGTDDTIALNACRDHCAESGKTMLLISRYKYVGTFVIDKPISVRGTHRDKAGIGLSIDRTIPGIHILASDCTFESMTVSSHSPNNIQNGQGDNATCFTLGRIYYPENRDGEDKLIQPPLLKGNVLRDLNLIRPVNSKGGHAITYAGRVGGVLVEDVLFQGFQGAVLPDRDSVLGDAILSHWGMIAEMFPVDNDGIVIKPEIMQRPDDEDAYTYHPNNLTARRLRLRNCGRLLAFSASYNIHITDVDMDGYDDGVRGNGQQILNLTVGDDADVYAHPDDRGKVYSNIRVENVVGWNIDGSSPNPAGTSLFDWPGAATSKYTNTDNTLAKNDIFGIRDIPVTSIPASGSVYFDVTVANGDPTGQAPSCWYSWEETSDYLDLDVSKTSAVLNATTIRVTFHNNGIEVAELRAGKLTAFVSKKRSEWQPKWTGCEFSNWRMYGVGNTENLINIRNARAFAKFENIDARGLQSTDGLLVQQTIGRLDFRDCIIPGKTELIAVDGASFDNCSFENTDVVALTIADTSLFARGDVVVGDDSQVTGVVYQIVSGSVLRVRLTGAPWQVFTEGEILIGPAGSSTIAIGGVDFSINNTVLITGDPVSAPLEVDLEVGETVLHLGDEGFGKDVRIGDKISYAGGVVYATRYADRSEVDYAITPAPAAAEASDDFMFRLERASRNIQFNNCEIVGGGRGLDVSKAYGIQVTGGTIRDCGQYGVLVDFEATVDLEGVAFSNNGVWGVQLVENFSSRDVAVGAKGTLRADRLVFNDSQWAQYNLLVNAEAVGGHLRDSIFVPLDKVGAPGDAYSYMFIAAGTFDQSNNRDAAGLLYAERALSYDPPALLNGNSATKTIFVPGARTSDTVSARFSTPLDGVTMTASVSSVDVVSVVFQNSTGSTKNLASGTLETVVNRT